MKWKMDPWGVVRAEGREVVEKLLVLERKRNHHGRGRKKKNIWWRLGRAKISLLPVHGDVF